MAGMPAEQQRRQPQKQQTLPVIRTVFTSSGSSQESLRAIASSQTQERGMRQAKKISADDPAHSPRVEHTAGGSANDPGPSIGPMC